MKYLLPGIFAVTAVLCLLLLFGPTPFKSDKEKQIQARVVSPQQELPEDHPQDTANAEQLAYDDTNLSKIALAEGEQIIALETQDFDGDGLDEQVIALRKGSDADGPILLTYVDYDQGAGAYKRVWNGTTVATRSRTFSLHIKDLVGDRSHCIVATGMNAEGEQTLTAYRLSPEPQKSHGDPSFEHIAEFHTDGSLVVVEKERSQAYQTGLSNGESFRIASYGRDLESSNILDQIETSYAWDTSTRRYERVGTARVPGTQIEQRRVRELLDGTPTKFEQFLEGLWYFVPAEGDVYDKQYLYFNPTQREIVFYSDNTEEVFTWKNSTPTRYGLYIATQNISIATLRRLVDIELSAIDSVHVKVVEDVKLKIGITDRWSGTYHKMSDATPPGKQASVKGARIEATYEGSDGRLEFHQNGSCESTLEEVKRPGLYAFFSIGETELLELRIEKDGKTERTNYEVLRSAPVGGTGTDELLTLRKVRLGVKGLDQLHERDLQFSRVQ